MSLNTYLEAAHRDGRAPFDPKELLQPEALDDYDPNKVTHQHESVKKQGGSPAQLSVTHQQELVKTTNED